MSTGGRWVPVERTLLCASVGPLASWVIANRFGEQLEQVARRFELVGSPEALAVAVQLRRALAEMAEAARLRNLAQAENGSGDGTAEPGRVVSRAGSVSPPGRLTAGEVAERFQVSREYVRRLCRDGGLSATKQGREWLIDPESAADWITTRSTA